MIHNRGARLFRQLLMALAAGMFAACAQAQSCVTGTFEINGESQPVSGASGSDSRPVYFGSMRYRFESYGESASMYSAGGSLANLTLDREYRFLGVPTGTPVSQLIIVDYDGGGYNMAGCCSPCTGNASSIGLRLDDGLVFQASGGSHLGTTGCAPGRYKSFQSLQMVRPAGTPFRLTTLIGCRSNELGNSDITMSTRFLHLTPGAFLVRCDGTQVAQTIVGVGGELADGLRITSIWPNPSRGVFHANVFVPMGAPAFLRVFDVAGRVVQSRAVDPSVGARDIAFDTRMAPGTYFLHLQQGVQTALRQVVIAE